MARFRLTQPPVFIALGLVVAAIAVNVGINGLIPELFPNRPVVEDLLFRLTPTVFSLQYIVDAIVVLSSLIVAWYGLRVKPVEFSFIVSVFAVAELLRGVLMILTPIGPSFPSMQYGLTTYPQYGQFPSGHTVIVMVAYLVVDGSTAPRIKNLLLGLALLEILSLILSRGHYSIDIVGGFFVAYLTYRELSRYKARLTLTP